MIVIIEGLDGVGKTTISKELCKRYNYIYIKESFTNDTNEKYQRIVNMLKKLGDDKIYIYDRSTIIDNKIYSFLNDKNDDFEISQDVENMILDNCKIIHLILEENKRKERFLSRGDKYITNDLISKISQNYIDFYKQRSNFIYLLPLVDDIEENINKIIKIIKK